ncbi:hypothetical protein BL250_17285 [Erwinia sp. OLTSP20]|nr:hypothetical protein BV501_13880 [Erwinia sp. OAMSP11]PIJ70466.1 hypothetical protein BK416_13490 [Erwinia sp. OLSSP12]PIJ79959.1 hypothetical protein BLD47_12425 [Erwinia sp. OLCASP19]PIJ81321.1 hypothetical protein BLD46_12880 [Erwinia sp. OLMTSP26]PIJ83864.1 hypothetical protein BLD49_12710 [Erwinia sp. OLMDSP33]PIJ88562.1 hypothetical protein BL250_17285 [Erwinia sp. OLTSP20]PIJ89297.1 hypothetical protein BL249_16720 [Erwinia sp. OLFS4]
MLPLQFTSRRYQVAGQSRFLNRCCYQCCPDYANAARVAVDVSSDGIPENDNNRHMLTEQGLIAGFAASRMLADQNFPHDRRRIRTTERC